jgi:hypothetical protein
MEAVGMWGVVVEAIGEADGAVVDNGPSTATLGEADIG